MRGIRCRLGLTQNRSALEQIIHCLFLCSLLLALRDGKLLSAEAVSRLLYIFVRDEML